MRIFIIGSGNVATHLAQRIADVGFQVVGVCSSTLEHAQQLAHKFGCSAFNQADKIPSDADVYLISISDDKIAGVAAQMPQVDGIVAHTAGSVDVTVLDRFANHGVLYPMQSFSKNRKIDVSQVPFFVEGSNQPATEKLLQLASALSGNVRQLASAERKLLHLSAVFASNFVNGMFAEAENVLQRCGLPFSLLKPLIDETVAKALEMGPVSAQTGPARRNDTGVMSMQQNMLDDENLRKLYSFASKRIADRYKNKQ